jgi:hypothetical protein
MVHTSSSFGPPPFTAGCAVSRAGHALRCHRATLGVLPRLGQVEPLGQSGCLWATWYCVRQAGQALRAVALGHMPL